MVTSVAPGLCRVAPGDGVDDRPVLLDRPRRLGAHSQREHSGPVRLVHDCPGDASEPAVAAALDQGAVEEVVGGRPRRQVIAFQGLPHRLVGLGELDHAGASIATIPAGEQLRGRALEGDDDVIDLAHVLGRDRADEDFHAG